MKARVILHKQNILKISTTKAPPKMTVPIANYAAVINSHALSKKSSKRTVVKAQILLSKQPMLCFVQKTQGLPIFPQNLLKNTKIQQIGNNDSVLGLRESTSCCGTKKSG